MHQEVFGLLSFSLIFEDLSDVHNFGLSRDFMDRFLTPKQSAWLR